MGTGVGEVEQRYLKVVDHQLIIQSLKEKFGTELKVTVIKARSGKKFDCKVVV